MWSSTPPLPLGPTASINRRFGARLIDGAMELVVAAIVVAAMPHGRPVAADLIAGALVCGYETLAVAQWGATAGKRMVGLRVVGLDQPAGRVSGLAALRRGVVVSLCCLVGLGPTFIVPVLAIVGLALSVGLSPHRRGAHDRLAATYVVDAASVEPAATITTADLDRWVDPDHIPQWTTYGRLATLEERRRARTGRLDGNPVLVLILVAVPLGLVAWLQSGWALLWSALAWLVAFVIDETWRVARQGQTPGHARYGLAVADIATGRPPSGWRSFWRAVVLALFMFIPLLVPVLALWIKVSADSRGPHDLAGHTMVIAHPARAGGAVPVPPAAPTVPQTSF